MKNFNNDFSALNAQDAKQRQIKQTEADNAAAEATKVAPVPLTPAQVKAQADAKAPIQSTPVSRPSSFESGNPSDPEVLTRAEKRKAKKDREEADEIKASGQNRQDQIDIAQAHGHPITSSVDQKMVDESTVQTPVQVQAKKDRLHAYTLTQLQTKTDTQAKADAQARAAKADAESKADAKAQTASHFKVPAIKK